MQSKKSAVKARPKSLLEAFENIVALAKGSNLDTDFLAKASVSIKYASRKLKLSSMQAVLLALFVERSEDKNIRLSEIAAYVECRTTKILRLSAEIDILEEKHYLRASHSSEGLCYRVPREVLKSLKIGQPYIHVKEPITDLHTFFCRFNDLMKEMDNEEITHNALLGEVKEGLEEIKHSYFVKQLKVFKLGDEELLLFIFMAHLFIENDDDHIGFDDIKQLYDDSRIPYWVKSLLQNRILNLFDHNLIENANDSGMASSDSFKLTKYAKTNLLSELDLKLNSRSRQNLLKVDSFVEKKLIYNESEQSQVAELSSILSDERFREVQSRLRSVGMRIGFCCLFYGASGTGKTETVYQIARVTGRDIFRVDVDKIKSCWVGESEQNMKHLFTSYRSLCRDSEIAPILLFNEADAVLGIRQEGAARAVDKMENSLQNIILQEMETLEGIMIATTNLTANLDKAFERRFLYKIRYEKPTDEARAQIWQSMLPGLNTEDAHTLAVEFDLSGGEIENVVRKHTVNAILTGQNGVDLQLLKENCRMERLDNHGRRRIGF